MRDSDTPAPFTPTILVVDDTPSILRLLSEHLESQGMKVSVAVDGEEALGRARILRPDLILMDVMMPVLDGMAALHQLMNTPEIAAIPVIMMTSLHDTERKVEGFKAGAVDYLTKPLQLDEVTARIRTHLSLQELRRRLESKNARLMEEVRERLRVEDALRESHELLERRVRERTAELAETNQRLSEEISERGKAENSLRQAQKMEVFGQLAGGVAHDFNNILTIILGQAQCVDYPDTTPQEQTDALREISEAARRASNLTRQMLLFSRKQSIQKAMIQPNKVIVELTKMLRRMIGEDVTLQLNLCKEQLTIHGDTAMLEQVLMNMAVNARDAMPRGGFLSISSECVILDEAGASGLSPEAYPGCFVRIDVRDTGEGIPKDRFSDIFEPFYTTKKAGQGTGLGLAICMNVVQQHRGWIAVESDPGRGTVFHIHLPVANEEERTESLISDGEALSPRKGRILLVEDEEGVRKSAARMLLRSGYTVVEAADAAEAISAWDRLKGGVDLLLTDVVMPGQMSGHDLAEHLSARSPGLRVLFMSGYDPSLLAMREPERTIPKNYLPKPFSIADLTKAVSKALS